MNENVKYNGFKISNVMCPFCSCGCRMYARAASETAAPGFMPIRNHPVTRGSLCIRGWNAGEYIHHPDRLTVPWQVVMGTRHTGAWEDLFRNASERISGILDKYGPDGIAFIGSSRCTNEDNYMLVRFARDIIGTGNIDARERLDYFPVLDTLHESTGYGVATASLDDISGADCIFVIGSDLSSSCPQGMARVLKGLHNHASLIVMDPRKTPLSKLASIHLRVNPGTDLHVINTMISHLITEDALNAEFLNGKSTGYGRLRKALKGISTEFVESLTGISMNTIKQATAFFANSSKAVIIIGSGITCSGDVRQTMHAILNLGYVTGHAGGKGSGIIVTGANYNTQGAWDMGISPDRLPGGLSIADTGERAVEYLGFSRQPVIGKNYRQILDGILAGDIHALYVMGDNPLLFNHSYRDLWESLEKLDLLVVNELFPTDMTDLADFVFPAAAPFEKGGTVTNLERRVQRFDPAVSVPGIAKPDWEIINGLCRAFDKDTGFTEVSDVTDDIAAKIPLYEGLTSRNLGMESKGITWLRKENGDPGQPWLQPSWKGKFLVPVTYGEKPQNILRENQLVLIPGRMNSFWGTGTRSSRAHVLFREEIKSSIHINPEDAKRLNVKHGWRVRVHLPTGKIETSVTVSEDLPQGLAYLPLHNVDGRYNQFGKQTLTVRIESC